MLGRKVFQRNVFEKVFGAGSRRSRQGLRDRRRSGSEGQKGKGSFHFYRAERSILLGDTAAGRAAGQADAAGDPTDRVECLIFTPAEPELGRDRLRSASRGAHRRHRS